VSLVDVGAPDDFPEGRIQIVDINGREVGILNWRGTWYAVRNVCPHLGAPLCAGQVHALLETTDAADTLVADAKRPVLMCPWHRWEFDLGSGRALSGNERIRMHDVRIERERVFVDPALKLDDA
jgi:nitrite reductase (NADH) small subunit